MIDRYVHQVACHQPAAVLLRGLHTLTNALEVDEVEEVCEGRVLRRDVVLEGEELRVHGEERGQTFLEHDGACLSLIDHVAVVDDALLHIVHALEKRACFENSLLSTLVLE